MVRSAGLPRLPRLAQLGVLAAFATWATIGLAAAPADAPAVVRTPQARAELVADAPEGIAPGKPLSLGLQLQHEPGWHSYWQNPGDTGLPTKLEWTLPEGVVAGAIDWPAPRKIPVGTLTNYGYEGTVLLPVPISIGPGFKDSTLPVKLHAEWLVCLTECIPQSGDFSLVLPTRQPLTAQHVAFAASVAARPKALRSTGSVKVEDNALSLSLNELPAELQGHPLTVFTEQPGVVDTAPPEAPQWSGATWTAQLPLAPSRSARPERMAFLLAAADASHSTETGRHASADARAWRVDLPVSGAWPAPVKQLPQELALRANSQAQAAPRVMQAHGMRVWLPLSAAIALGAAALVALCVLAAAGARRTSRRLSALALMGVALGFALWFVALPPSGPDGMPPAPTPEWQDWQPGRVDQLLAAGQPVWLTLTPAACLACAYQQQHVWADPQVQTVLRKNQFALLAAQNPEDDPALAALLRQLGNPKLPAQVFWRPDQAPLVLVGLPSAQDIRSALTASAVQAKSS